MKNFELKTLIYKETENLRTFFSSDFNFIFDKNNRYSVVYGSTYDETPSYDPLSPEEVTIILDKSFIFKNNIDKINQLFNIKDENGKLITISTISTVNIKLDDIYDNNDTEICELIKYLDYFKFYINLILDYKDDLDLRDVLRLKILNVDHIIFETNDFDVNKLVENLQLFLSKNISVSYNFYTSNLTLEKFKKLIEANFPINTFSNVYINKKMSRKNKVELCNFIKEFGNFSIFDLTDVKIKTNNIFKNQDGLFKCIIDFTKRQVFLNMEFEGLQFDNLNSINSYWNSKQFINFRNLKIKNKYEE